MKMRFKVVSDSQISISPSDLLASAGCITKSSTEAYRIFEAVRIKYAKLVGAPPTAGNTSTVKMEFLGGNNRTNNDLLINTSNNPQICPSVYGKPSRYADASDWGNAGLVGQSFLTLLAPTNSILEIGVMLNRYEDNNEVSVFTVGLPTFTAGQFQYVVPDAGLEILA